MQYASVKTETVRANNHHFLTKTHRENIMTRFKKLKIKKQEILKS